MLWLKLQNMRKLRLGQCALAAAQILLTALKMPRYRCGLLCLALLQAVAHTQHPGQQKTAQPNDQHQRNDGQQGPARPPPAAATTRRAPFLQQAIVRNRHPVHRCSTNQ